MVFKKNKLLKVAGKEIHFNLIESNQWEEAETFFAWLGLSVKEIKELKKETLFHHGAASEMFNELMKKELVKKVIKNLLIMEVNKKQLNYF